MASVPLNFFKMKLLSLLDLKIRCISYHYKVKNNLITKKTIIKLNLIYKSKVLVAKQRKKFSGTLFSHPNLESAQSGQGLRFTP